jgi:hypothetical protein
LVKVDQIQTREIIPGRALILETKQHNGDPLSLLGVYASNAASENEEFWKKIQTFYETHDVRKPDIMGGDTNMVEDPIDRLPAYSDPEGPVSAFDDLKSYLGLVDGWRETYPTTKAGFNDRGS